MVEHGRGGVRIEIVPWLTQAFGHKGSSRLILEEQIDQDMGMVDFLASLHKRYPAVGEAIVDLRSGKLFDHVNIVHNDMVVGSNEALTMVVRQGDSLVFLPAYVGG